MYTMLCGALCISNYLLPWNWNTNPHCPFPIIKLVDISHMGSWHSCLRSSETLAPFLEFPKEWLSFTWRCHGWGHSSSQLTAEVWKKADSMQRTADEQLPHESFQLFTHYLRPSCDTIRCYMHKSQLCPRGCYLIETASLIAEINLREWRASFFKRGIQNTIRRRAKSFHNLYYWRPSVEVHWRCFFQGQFSREKRFLPFRFKWRQKAALSSTVVECFQCISVNARRLKFHFHTNLPLQAYFPLYLCVNSGLIHLQQAKSVLHISTSNAHLCPSVL